MTRFINRKQEIASRFSQAAAHYADYAALQAAIAESLWTGAGVDLHWQGCVLDAGCGCGRETQRLAALPGVTDVIALDIAPAMLASLPVQAGVHPVLGDMEAMPLATASVDAVFSNFAMQWCASREAVCAELARVLRPGGELRCSVPGPDSLHVLREAGLLRVNDFAAAQDWCGALAQAGFQLVSCQRQTFTMFFAAARPLLAAIKGLGANTSNTPRANHLYGRQWWRQVTAALEVWREPEGLPLAYKAILLRARRT